MLSCYSRVFMTYIGRAYTYEPRQCYMSVICSDDLRLAHNAHMHVYMAGRERMIRSCSDLVWAKRSLVLLCTSLKIHQQKAGSLCSWHRPVGTVEETRSVFPHILVFLKAFGPLPPIVCLFLLSDFLCCWTSRLSCHWCMHIEQFTFGH